jgi:hypothetical protein
MVLFRLSTGTKGKFRIFAEKKLNFSPLVSVKSPQEIEKLMEISFLEYFYRSKYLIFGPKIFFCHIWFLVLPPILRGNYFFH